MLRGNSEHLTPFMPVFGTLRPDALFMQPVRITPLMEEQRYARIENATCPRPVYPDVPSSALLASIEMRRAQLTGPRVVVHEHIRTPAATVSVTLNQLRAFEGEVGLR